MQQINGINNKRKAPNIHKLQWKIGLIWYNNNASIFKNVLHSSFYISNHTKMVFDISINRAEHKKLPRENAGNCLNVGVSGPHDGRHP